MRTYEDRQYWNNLRRSRDYYRQENVIVDGNDGENEFDAKILKAVAGKVVLDVGCGTGVFTIRIAERATDVVGVDFSEEAIRRAETSLSRHKIRNCRFEQADSNQIPFPDATFDVVVSRRGPVTHNVQSLSEALRVLKKGGTFMEITIGEKDKANIVRIFGRGQMFGVTERVVLSKKKMLEDVGFRIVELVDYLATEIFQSMDDLNIRLSSAPIIPDFDIIGDKKCLDLVEGICKTSRGIETEVHRVTIVAVKA
jgi:ubiquinone/menaquinone biosynthesis C-methylase UbiE